LSTFFSPPCANDAKSYLVSCISYLGQKDKKKKVEMQRGKVERKSVGAKGSLVAGRSSLVARGS
jgi:hypothetical protein